MLCYYERRAVFMQARIQYAYPDAILGLSSNSNDQTVKPQTARMPDLATQNFAQLPEHTDKDHKYRVCSYVSRSVHESLYV